MGYSGLFDDIRECVSIMDVVSGYVHLEKRGQIYSGLCPFHSEKTPSFCVYVDTNSFYCFGCGVGGDAISFVSLAEKLSYKESAEFLANKLGIEVSDGGFRANLLKKKEVYELNRLSAKFYYSFLTSKPENYGLAYIHSRGLKDSTIKHFGLGYSSNNGYSLVNYLKKNKFSEEVILKSNLGIKLRNGNLRDRFVNRIMFPVVDIKGNVVAFGARSLNNEKPKYLNTSDTIVFKKCDNLYSLNFAKKQKDYFILTEGYMDVISLYQLGFKSAVASLGTSLTLNQCKLISRYTNKLYICYDNDKAGELATERALTLLEKEKLLIGVMQLKGAKDPDEFIKINKENAKSKFKKILNNSLLGLEFRISNLEDKFDMSKTEDKIVFFKEITKIISKVSDPIERDIYSSKICSKYGISKDSFGLKIKKCFQREDKNYHFGLKNQNNMANLRHLHVEEFFISCIMKNIGFLKYSDDFTSEDFCGKITYKILEKIRFLVHEKKNVNVGSISYGFSRDGISEISRILNLAPNKKVSISEFLGYVKFLKRKKQVGIFRSSKSFDDGEILKFLDKLKSDKL